MFCHVGETRRVGVRYPLGGGGGGDIYLRLKDYVDYGNSHSAIFVSLFFFRHHTRERTACDITGRTSCVGRGDLSARGVAQCNGRDNNVDVCVCKEQQGVTQTRVSYLLRADEREREAHVHACRVSTPLRRTRAGTYGAECAAMKEQKGTWSETRGPPWVNFRENPGMTEEYKHYYCLIVLI